MLATRAVASSCFLTKSRIGPRPPRVAHPATAARSRYTPSHQAHAVQSRNKQQLNTQRETATVIHGAMISRCIADYGAGAVTRDGLSALFRTPNGPGWRLASSRRDGRADY